MSQGESSPLARMYDLDASVLLIGVGYGVNTCFHLAEYRCKFASSKKCERASSVLIDGKTEWTSYEDIYWYEEDFQAIGTAFEASGKVTVGKIGQADCRLFRLREAVDFAVEWMNKNRLAPLT